MQLPVHGPARLLPRHQDRSWACTWPPGGGVGYEAGAETARRRHGTKGHKQVSDVPRTMLVLNSGSSINTGGFVHVTSLTSVVISMLF